MADANTELKQIAIQIANELQGRNLHLHKEIQDAELHVAELKLQSESSSAARQRSLDFSPSLRGELQCPECFVRRDIKVSLRPVPSPDSNDIFACKTCGEQFVFTP